VRVALRLPESHSLDTLRREDLEKQFLAFRHPFPPPVPATPYFYEVTEEGEAEKDEKTIIHVSFHGGLGYYTAISPKTGTVYRLRGFEESVSQFNRMADDFPVGIGTEAGSLNYALFFLKAVRGFDENVIYDELDVKHTVERHFHDNFSSRAEQTKQFEKWWRHFSKAVDTLALSPEARVEKDHYVVVLREIELKEWTGPLMKEWTLAVSKNGHIRVLSVRTIFE